MKTYKKFHVELTAATNHRQKIEKRGGTATIFLVQGGCNIEYTFPKKVESIRKIKIPRKAVAKKQKPKQAINKIIKKNTKKAVVRKEAKKKYDVISPDGINIRYEGAFNSIEAREKYFKKWKEGFRRQGYYSSNNGRINLEDLRGRCKWIEY